MRNDASVLGGVEGRVIGRGGLRKPDRWREDDLREDKEGMYVRVLINLSSGKLIICTSAVGFSIYTRREKLLHAYFGIENCCIGA